MNNQITNQSQIKSHIRQIINLIFELDRRDELSMDDFYSLVHDLDNFLEYLNEREQNGR